MPSTSSGTKKRYVYTWRSRRALASIKAKVKAIPKQGTNSPLSILLRRLNAVLRGWTNYFRHGVSKDTFAYLHQFAWLRVVGWLRRKHRRANWRWLRRHYLANGWWPEHDGMALFDCRAVPVTRYLDAPGSRMNALSAARPFSGSHPGSTRPMWSSRHEVTLLAPSRSEAEAVGRQDEARERAGAGPAGDAAALDRKSVV